MNKLIYPLTCLTLLLTNHVRGDDLPFFGSLRTEIVSQLTIASNNLPLDKKLVSGLGANLKLIDKTKPNLISGTASLGTLAKGLGRTSLSNTFLPIVASTRAAYLDFIDNEKGLLEDRLLDTIPGKTRTAAQASLAKLSTAIEGTVTNANLAGSLKSLSKAATALGTAQKSVIKAETAKPGADFLLATVTESNEGVTTFKPIQRTILDATYDPSTGEIDIDGGELKKLDGGRVQVRFLSLATVVPGAGRHTLSLTNENGYAMYDRGVVLNINAPYPEVESQETYMSLDPINHRLGTGTINITLDLEANLVWGDFTFTAKCIENNGNHEVSMTGSFLLRLEVFE